MHLISLLLCQKLQIIEVRFCRSVVEITSDCVESKGAMGPKYHCVVVNTKFKEMVIEHAEETNNYTMLWEFHIAEQSV